MRVCCLVNPLWQHKKGTEVLGLLPYTILALDTALLGWRSAGRRWVTAEQHRNRKG